jgi:hypothetical protein
MILIDSKLPLPRSNSLPIEPPSSDSTTNPSHLAPPPPAPAARQPSQPLLERPPHSHVHFNRSLEVHTQSFRDESPSDGLDESRAEEKRRAQAGFRARDRFLKAFGTALGIWVLLGVVLGNLGRRL